MSISYDEAKAQARANADYFQRPYCVISATNGALYVERYATQNESCVLFVAQPVKRATADNDSEAA